MDLIEEKKIILQLMNDKHYVPMKFKELVVILNVRKEDRGLLDIVLTELLNEGKITISKKENIVFHRKSTDRDFLLEMKKVLAL